MCMGLEIYDRQCAEKHHGAVFNQYNVVHPQLILTSTDVGISVQSSKTAAMRRPTQELDLPGLAQLEDFEDRLHHF